MPAIGHNVSKLLFTFYFPAIIRAYADQTRPDRQFMHLLTGYFAGIAADTVSGIYCKNVSVLH